MFLKQFYLGCLAQASYLVGDEAAGAAAVIDPRRDVQQYLDEARARDLRITHVVLTHFHADFVAGHIELRDRVGAQICLGAAATAEYSFTPLHDGETLEFGNTRLEFLETPGHTPEGISILVHDLAADAGRPHAVLTGDTLFIGDVGRPDLMASEGTTVVELAGSLYDSLHAKLLPLPDETLLYPGHGGGSLCGKAIGDDTVSNMGTQRRYNYALQPMSKGDFIRMLTADLPDAPDYFSYDARLNRSERPTLQAALERALAPLPLEEALRRRDEGAQLLDVRDPGAFAAAHVAGSINIGLGGQYAPWVGSMLSPDRSLVIVAEPGQEEEAATRLGRIGFDAVVGYLDGGMAALEARPDLVARFARLAPATLAEALRAPDPPFLLDVRDAPELQEGRIEGSAHFPLRGLAAHFDDLPRDRPLVLYCGGGYRSAIAASLLLQRGFQDVTDLAGGYAAWTATATPA